MRGKNRLENAVSLHRCLYKSWAPVGGLPRVRFSLPHKELDQGRRLLSPPLLVLRFCPSVVFKTGGRRNVSSSFVALCGCTQEPV